MLDKRTVGEKRLEIACAESRNRDVTEPSAFTYGPTMIETTRMPVGKADQWGREDADIPPAAELRNSKRLRAELASGPR